MECISERQVNVAEQPVPADAGRRLGLSSVAFGPARLHFVVRLRREAERAKLKSCKDGEIIAQGKRGTSAALGYYHAAPLPRH